MESHRGTASYLPESHLFQMLFHQPTAQVCVPVQDRLTAGWQSLQGFSGSLGLMAPKFCFQPKTSPHLIIWSCLPVQPTHCLCCNDATDTPVLPVVPPQDTVRAAQHAPSLWQKVSYKGMARPTQTDKQGLRGSTHHSLYRLLPAHRVPKSKEKQGLMGRQVCSPTASVCALPSEAARAVGSPVLPE